MIMRNDRCMSDTWRTKEHKRTANTLKSLQIHVPKAVLNGHSAELMCSYELEGAQLYSIRWYRNMIEFYRYVARSDQNRVVLTEVDRTLTGEYQCEVSADAPLFHTDIKAAEMVVVEPPLIGPNITSDRMTYVGGDHIHANCSSPPSLPAANITWYVNEQMLPFPANNKLKCEASIFDVWQSMSHTLVLRERNANPVSALGRSLTGGATKVCIPTILVLILQIILQLTLENCTETAIR
ncbi:unnamed protein product [Leptidea sinapis]|uniref:Ig-like domain-containing protein n=1 Tax=Leptidea sinapis TaxID=189913 RepID=A0A5E4PRX5_9NEOP|nr:unnamed protein product [Leptidea sinapis]